MLSKTVEDLLNVLQVIYPNFVENEDVIHIYDHKEIGEWSQDNIHQSHKNCLSISQAKRHDQSFENTFLRLEGSLRNINLFDWDLVIS